jgi:hypothetical protein
MAMGFGNGNKKKMPPPKQVVSYEEIIPEVEEHEPSFYGNGSRPLVDLQKFEETIMPPVKEPDPPNKIDQIALLILSLTYGEKMELVESMRLVAEGDNNLPLPPEGDLARIFFKWGNKRLEVK